MQKLRQVGQRVDRATELVERANSLGEQVRARFGLSQSPIAWLGASA